MRAMSNTTWFHMSIEVRAGEARVMADRKGKRPRIEMLGCGCISRNAS